MGQLYLQRFEYRGAIGKKAFDKAWGIANEAMAKTGNWGNVKKRRGSNTSTHTARRGEATG